MERRGWAQSIKSRAHRCRASATVLSDKASAIIRAQRQLQGRCSAAAPERVQNVGIRVNLPFEQDVNAFVGQAFEHRTFFTRLHQFALTSDAYIVAPGGIGTVLETLMIRQLLQVRHLQAAPLILVGRMWPGLVEWTRATMLSFDPQLANAEDRLIPQRVPHADEAIRMIGAHHARW